MRRIGRSTLASVVMCLVLSALGSKAHPDEVFRELGNRV